MLEMDGKFEERSWIKSEKAKVLNNPGPYAQLMSSQDKLMFPSLRENLILLSSIPFELNLKANLYCTVSPNLSLWYSASPC